MNINDLLDKCQTKKWESLNISHRGLVILPARISQLTNLKKLLLNDNRLILPPEEILHLDQLEELILDQNQLTVLPGNISSLKHLTYLGVNHNPLSVLPDALGELRELRELWAINCGLTSVPASIGKLSKLHKLGLSSNCITTLPPQFGNLKSLQWLNLADNTIENVPENFKSLQSLVFINFNKNSFRKIPKQLTERAGRFSVQSSYCSEEKLRMTGHKWGYGEEDGPSAWHRSYPLAQGARQSPINIVPEEAVYDSRLPAITVSYDNCTSLTISNNGHSVVVEFEDMDDRSVIQGGPLENAYRLKQFHFHWGGKDCNGSEHTVSGKTFVSELHLVHWNAVRYRTFGEAAAAPDGLAVLGIFMEGSIANFKGFNPKCLLPPSLRFWTYPGSLTTPPLLESVTWIVLAEPITVSEKQMAKFRMLLFSAEEEEQRKRMENNFRPPQPLKGRTVRASFK
ncbi:Carbonic anhydrase 7 [Bagarius yarrelli]|uniref:Carbonic anhydrase n=1 Tax=Bagarius yarrelli TaxID=175774 RepID=A0A556TLK4_BAGYA|nr:Carbonic anhydrase 7 [Bagarius yarrelli]